MCNFWVCLRVHIPAHLQWIKLLHTSKLTCRGQVLPNLVGIPGRYLLSLGIDVPPTNCSPRCIDLGTMLSFSLQSSNNGITSSCMCKFGGLYWSVLGVFLEGCAETSAPWGFLFLCFSLFFFLPFILSILQNPGHPKGRAFLLFSGFNSKYE